MSQLKRWNGSRWVDSGIGNFIKKWDGKKWINAIVRRWDGKNWAVISQQQFTKDFNVTWTRSYGGNNKYKGDNIVGSRNRLYQGRYSDPDIQWNGDWGIQKSMAGFDDASIRRELEGATIDRVQLYIENWWWWYWAGGQLWLGAHNQSNPPSTFSETRYSMAWASWSQRGGGRWIEIPRIFAEDLRDGKARGFTVHRATTDPYYYGYFYGAGHGGKSPKLRITYTK
ncbi:hypothetical protein [Enterococcus mundtii]|uniref:hypothetical protein n=1 Tax=Enterococcus mundtii TaxID=53346 RepID=UPI001A95C9F0|nr:hypothetical protein [Enterococcus mundtii]MBO1087230.1 hypothetical protein [Enterococcus mundtii]